MTETRLVPFPSKQDDIYFSSNVTLNNFNTAANTKTGISQQIDTFSGVLSSIRFDS